MAGEIKITIGGDASGVQKAAQQANAALQSIGPPAKQATSSFAKIGSSLKDLGSSIVGSAGIGIAFSVVGTLISSQIEKYGNLGNAIDALIGNYSKMSRAVEDLNTTLAESQSKVSGEISVINSLVAIAKDETLTRDTRNEAIKKLNKEYDKYLPNLTLENIETKEVAKSIDNLTASIVRQAKVKGVQDLIAKETKKQAEVYVEALDQIERGNKGFKGLLNFLANPQLLGSGVSGATAELYRLGKVYQDAENRIQLFNKSITSLLTEDAIAGTLFGDEITRKAKKGADALQLQISALEKLKKAVDDAGLDSTEVVEKLIPLKIRLTIRDAAKNGLTKQEIDLMIQALQKELSEAFKKQALRLEGIPKLKLSKYEVADIPDIESKVAKAAGFDKKIPAITMPAIRIKFLGFELGNAINQAQAQMAALKETLLKSTIEGVTEAASIFGETIGSIFSGGDVGSSLANAAKGFLSIIGSVLQAVGRQILVTSKLVKALKLAIDKLFGPGGEIIAAGVGLALIAFGGALKNINFDIPKLAKGGIALGPTLGIFGEAGKEAIIPLDRLPDLMGNVNAAVPQVFIGNTIIKGSDLEIIFQRTQQGRARLG